MGLESRKVFFFFPVAMSSSEAIHLHLSAAGFSGLHWLRVFLGCICRNVYVYVTKKCYTCKYIYTHLESERVQLFLCFVCLSF